MKSRRTAKKASAVQPYTFDSAHSDLVASLSKALTAYANEHYPSSSSGVYPTADDGKIAIVLVANKYSPNNFW